MEVSGSRLRPSVFKDLLQALQPIFERTPTLTNVRSLETQVPAS